MRITREVMVALFLTVVICRLALAESNQNGNSVNSGAIKAGVAIVIVGVGLGITYLALHDRGTIMGCVQADSHGTRIVDEENKKSYALLASASVVVPPGDRVKLKGKKRNNCSGEAAFHVERLVKDYGHCQH